MKVRRFKGESYASSASTYCVSINKISLCEMKSTRVFSASAAVYVTSELFQLRSVYVRLSIKHRAKQVLCSLLINYFFLMRLVSVCQPLSQDVADTTDFAWDDRRQKGP